MGEVFGEAIDLLLGALFIVPVSALYHSQELISFARDAIDVIVRQLSPLLSDFTLEGQPLTLNLIPVHTATPYDIVQAIPYFVEAPDLSTQ